MKELKSYSLTLFLISLFCCSFNQTIIAQDSANLEVEGKVIDGSYHPYKKTFKYESSISHRIKDETLSYYAYNFIEGLSIVEKKHFYYKMIFNDETNEYVEESDYEHSFGVIDTLGNIIIPCTYSNLFRPSNYPKSDVFLFTNRDSLFLINKSNKVLFGLRRYPEDSRIAYITKVRGIEYVSKESNDINQNTDYLEIEFHNREYLFDKAEGRLILPSILQNTTSHYHIENEDYKLIKCNSNFAIFKYFEGYLAYNLIDKTISNHCSYIDFFNDSLLYLKCNDSLYITNDVRNPTNMFGYTYIEYFCKNIYEVVYSHLNEAKYHNFYLVNKDDRFGVVTSGNRTIIPLIYEDLYVIDKNFFWVKKNDLWAICTRTHKLVTPFEFIDIDKMNKVNFDNLMFLTRLSPLIVGESLDLYEFDSSFKASHLCKYMGFQKRLINTHHYFSSVNEDIRYFFAKKEDGYHLIWNDSNRVNIESKAWDNIFIADKYRIGYQKGDKFGFKVRKIKYDRIMLDLYTRHCSYYGTSDNRIYVSAEFVIKNDKMYGYTNYDRNALYKIGPYYKYGTLPTSYYPQEALQHEQQMKHIKRKRKKTWADYMWNN